MDMRGGYTSTRGALLLIGLTVSTMSIAVAIKIFLLAVIFVATSGTVFSDWGRRHPALVIAASIVAVISSFYLFAELYKDLKREAANEAVTTLRQPPVPQDDAAERARQDAETRETQARETAERERREAEERARRDEADRVRQAQRDAEDKRRSEEEARRVTRLDADRGAKPLTDAELTFVRGVTQPLPDQSFKECAACPEMVVVPPGEFVMGSPEGEGDADERPQHKQTIPAPFAVGRTHVTRGEFAAFAKATNHKPDGGCYGWTGTTWELDVKFSWRDPGFTPYDDRHPVVCVNAKDAEAYVAWLSEQTPGAPYRLLSESEWEYAGRGVTKATAQPRYFFGNEARGLCTNANGLDEAAKEKFPNWTVAPCRDGYVFTAPAGSFKANPFGLHDVHGNAWEWTADCWSDSYKDKPARLKATGGAGTT